MHKKRVWKRTVPLLVVLSLLLTLSPLTGLAAQTTPEEPPTTGFEDRNGESPTTHEEELAFLEELATKSERVTYSQIGSSVEGRPIHLVRVGYPEPPSDEEIAAGRNILIMGTPHGNEPAGREMTLKLMRDLAFTEEPELLDFLNEATVLFVPTPNPDGREANTRGNAWGVDNNRDHLNLETPEMQAIAGVLNQFHPDITVDAHERPRATGNPDIEVLWPRNLNVDEELRALNIELVQDYMRPDIEAAGFSTGLYGTPGGAGGGDERILRNMAGLRHGLGILTETAGQQALTDRVDAQMEAAQSILRFYRERFDDVVQAVSEAPQRRAVAGGIQESFYLDGSDNRQPPDWAVLDPAPCGYLINTSQAKDISRHIELFSLKTDKVSENGVFVTMHQPMMTVVPFLLDERARYNEINGLALYDCSDPGAVEPPLGSPSVANLNILVDRLQAEKEFRDDATARLLHTHLKTVGHYEDKGLTEKVVKHLESFKQLLDHQREKELISEKAYNALGPLTVDLLKRLQHAFYHDFRGDDGDTWDAVAFLNLHSWPSNPPGATFTIRENTGQIVLDNRLQGNGSAYGRITPDMGQLEDSELLVRFRVDEVGNNQRMRLWLQADKFSSGSSMPVNGYGVELHLGTDTLTLRGREDSSSTNFGSTRANLSTDWHRLRLRVQGDQLMVRLWNDGAEEPDEWDMVHTLSSSGSDKRSGRVLMSVINFDYDSGNTFYLDEIIVNDLSK